MAEPRLVLCGSARLTSRKADWREAAAIRLTRGRGPTDVHLRVLHITRAMRAAIPPVAEDLLDIAAYVYVADQVVRRGGAKQTDFGRRWRRRLRFEVPVRRPEVWRDPAVTAALSETLEFLADDEEYEFGFSPGRDLPPPDGHLFDEVDPCGQTGFQAVALFSGGLDSLGGAVQEILQGQRKVALVSHRPVSKTYRRQRDLVEAINRRHGESRLRPLHVSVEINKGRKIGGEVSQRSRSFLFAAVAATVARLVGLQQIRFYENGVTSLNLPMSPQVIGGRASRTTHPKALQGFQRLFRLIFCPEFTVVNPYQC